MSVSTSDLLLELQLRNNLLVSAVCLCIQLCEAAFRVLVARNTHVTILATSHIRVTQTVPHPDFTSGCRTHVCSCSNNGAFLSCRISCGRRGSGWRRLTMKLTVRRLRRRHEARPAQLPPQKPPMTARRRYVGGALAC